MEKILFIISYLLLSLALLFFMPWFQIDQAQASEVVLSLESTATVYQVGDIFEVKIKLNTGSQKAVTTKVYLNYDVSKLAALGGEEDVFGAQLSVVGTSFEAIVDNQANNLEGTIVFSGYRLSPFLSGQDLLLGTIVFKAIGPGSASIEFSDDCFVIDPVEASNILTGTTNSTLAIEEATGRRASLSLDPLVESYEIGQVFNLNIILNTNNQITDKTAIVLNYSPSLLEIQDADSTIAGVQIKAGSLYSLTQTNLVDTTKGEIKFIQVASEGKSYSGQGILATLSFKVLAKGSAAIIFDSTQIENNEQNILNQATGGQYDLAEPNSELSPISNFPYPDGSLLKGSGPKVYLIEDGQKRWITSADVFASQEAWQSIIVVTDQILAVYPNGSDIFPKSSPSVSLVKVQGNDKVYIIEAGLKRHIPSIEVFNSYNYEWSSIVEISAAELDQYPRVKHVKLQNNEKVYYITESGLKRHIISAEVFNSYGGNWQDIAEISQTELEAYPINDLIKAEGDYRVYKLENGQKRWIKTILAFEQNGYNWLNIAPVNQIELTAYSVGLPIE